MRVLGLDTAFASVGVALWEGDAQGQGRVLAAQAQAMERGHAEALMGMIDAVMTEADVSFDALDRIAVTRGPGAFTGIRIGLAAARGLALSTGALCIGVGTFAAVAANVEDDERDGRALLVAFDTKRKDFYGALIEKGSSFVGEGQVVSTEGLAAFLGGKSPLLVVGDGAQKAVGILRDGGMIAEISVASSLPDAGRLAALAATLDDTQKPEPLYLRPPIINMPGQERTD